MTTNDEGATMDDELIAAVKRAAKRRHAATRAREEASAVLADAARRLVKPNGPMSQRDFAELAGVERTTVRAWTGKAAMNRPRRTRTPG